MALVCTPISGMQPSPLPRLNRIFLQLAFVAENLIIVCDMKQGQSPDLPFFSTLTTKIYDFCSFLLWLIKIVVS
jgi:hypothetical protein